MEGAVEATAARVEALCGTMLPVERVRHEEAPVAEALTRLQARRARRCCWSPAPRPWWTGAMSARPRSCAPAGVIDHFGMPVDPGNLLCLGRIGDIPAMVLPGCARSPKLNGFDWVLQRLFAGVPVGAARHHGDGRGRPAEGDRGPPAAARTGPARRRRRRSRRAARAPVAAIVLAAGRSRRMAPLNKLLVADAQGTPMVARVVDNVLASHARPVIVVTGHERDRVEEALAGRPVHLRPCRGLRRGPVGLAQGRPRRAAAGCRGRAGLPGRHAAGGRADARPPDRRLRPGGRPRHRHADLPRQAGQPDAVGRANSSPRCMTITGDVGARHLVGSTPTGWSRSRWPTTPCCGTSTRPTR